MAQQAAVWVVPSQQRLDSDDLAVGQLRQWLIKQAELAAAPGYRQGHGQPAPKTLVGIALEI
jgi:hypothetical protein